MMKTTIKWAAIAAGLLSLVSCEEFGPVFTGKYPDLEYQEPVKIEEEITPIAELVSLYKNGQPFKIDDDIIISGKVTTTDQPGNFYKSLYIQDETGGIEIKIGRNGLYNDYKPGQTLYIKCKGLTIGQYGYKDNPRYGGAGMVQLGYSSTINKYETSYMESPILIDRHIIKGEYGEPVVPVEITEDELPDKFDTQVKNKNIGRLVTLKGLRYANEVFVLMYLDSNQNKEAAKNRIFLSGEKTWGITTWAMSKEKMRSYITSGIWDEAEIGSGNDKYGTVGEKKGDGSYPEIEKTAYAVSQYFKMGDKDIQIRTSGFCKFADKEIDRDVLEGRKTIDVTGIITLYQGKVQFLVNSIDDVHVN